MEQLQHDQRIHPFHGKPSSNMSSKLLSKTLEKVRNAKETRKDANEKHNAENAIHSSFGNVRKHLTNMSKRSQKSEKMKESHNIGSKLYTASKHYVPSDSYRRSTLLKQNTGSHKKRKGREELTVHPLTLKFLQQLQAYLKKADTKLQT